MTDFIILDRKILKFLLNEVKIHIDFIIPIRTRNDLDRVNFHVRLDFSVI